MKQRALGASGITVSEIGIGTWQFGNTGQWQGPDADESGRIVHEALEHGVTFFDTAPAYAGGRSEELLGEALLGRRDDVVLCSKFGHTTNGGSDWRAKSIQQSVYDSLRRLRTDYLDVVLMHSPSPELYDGRTAEHYKVFAELVESGALRTYGASVDNSADLLTVVNTTDSQALEVRLSALYQEPWDAVELAKSHGLGSIVKVPLESGWLSGRYNAESQFSDVRSRWSRDEIAQRARLVDELRQLLPAGVPLTQASLAFLLTNEGVSTIIPGTKSLAQLRDSLAAVDVALPTDTVTAIRTWYDRELGDEPLAW